MGFIDANNALHSSYNAVSCHWWCAQTWRNATTFHAIYVLRGDRKNNKLILYIKRVTIAIFRKGHGKYGPVWWLTINLGSAIVHLPVFFPWKVFIEYWIKHFSIGHLSIEIILSTKKKGVSGFTFWKLVSHNSIFYYFDISENALFYCLNYILMHMYLHIS